MANFAEDTPQNLEELLSPGVPVLVETTSTYNYNTKIIKHLFFSNGKMDKNYFIAQEGEKNTVYASLSEKSYTLHICKESNKCIEYKDAWYYKHENSNEGTFARSGGTTLWISKSYGGTDVKIGEELKEEFSEVLLAIEFAQKSYVFNVSHFYHPDNFISIKKYSNNGEVRNHTLLSFAFKLLEKANKELNLFFPDRSDDFSDLVLLTKHDSIMEHQRKEGYPITDKDFIIRPRYTGPYLGFLKAGFGSSGEVFAMPTKEGEEVFKLAFSPEDIKKYFPFE
ncbi:hypothetical protein COX58_01115 [archaeon CG_4_10_14_0_2_um_filter_Archaea_38_6]|nr:MAG: hypothetical protein COX58_01115 [archaeon CG_4_10_14_0_2_um_filter_Archaea_38_6]